MYNTNYSFNTYWKNDLTCEVTVKKEGITFINHTTDPITLPFGINTTATSSDLEDFFEERCFPRERANCKDILNSLGLECYEPELICRKTHGLQFDDFLWIQFSDEPQVTWDEIKLRD